MQFKDFRPLRAIGNRLSHWARSGYKIAATNENSGRIRAFADHIGMALGWMSKGYQYDDRTFMQRMKAGRYFWHMAFACLLYPDKRQKVHIKYAR